MSQKFKDSFYPAHELGKEAVVVGMYLMHEFVEVVFVALAKINKSLNSLVGVSRNVLFATFVHHHNHVIDEDGEVGDAVVDIGRLIDSD